MCPDLLAPCFTNATIPTAQGSKDAGRYRDWVGVAQGPTTGEMTGHLSCVPRADSIQAEAPVPLGPSCRSERGCSVMTAARAPDGRDGTQLSCGFAKFCALRNVDRATVHDIRLTISWVLVDLGPPSTGQEAQEKLALTHTHARTNLPR